MNTWLQSIDNGLTIATTYGLFFLVPSAVVTTILNGGKINLKKIIFNALFFVYICCVLALVFFPLPEPGHVFDGFSYQLIPFYAIYDTATDFCMFSVFQMIFNVVMTMPFGVYFFYCRKMSFKKVVLITFCFSLFIEIGQLTGLFFIYPGSYRCCDVDDLILNTLGGYLGAYAVKIILNAKKNQGEKF